MLEAIGALGVQPADAGLRAAGDVAAQVHRLRTQLLPVPAPGREARVREPGARIRQSDDAFPKRLAGLAAMLAAGLPLRCVALTRSGRVRHALRPGPALAAGLQLTADSLLAFQRDLEARGLADRVLVHVWSEFGRRAEENGSSGTDHGAAGVGFLLGTRVKGTMIGEFPGLKTGLDDDGNVKATADFRGVYASLLEQWLGADAAAVHPGRRLVRAVRRCSRDRAPPPPPARVQVVAQEFRYVALAPDDQEPAGRSSSSATAARTSHDLRMRRVGGTRVYAWPNVPRRRGRRQDVQAPAGHVRALVQRREPSHARHAGTARREETLGLVEKRLEARERRAGRARDRLGHENCGPERRYLGLRGQQVDANAGDAQRADLVGDRRSALLIESCERLEQPVELVLAHSHRPTADRDLRAGYCGGAHHAQRIR